MPEEDGLRRNLPSDALQDADAPRQAGGTFSGVEADERPPGLGGDVGDARAVVVDVVDGAVVLHDGADEGGSHGGAEGGDRPDSGGDVGPGSRTRGNCRRGREGHGRGLGRGRLSGWRCTPPGRSGRCGPRAAADHRTRRSRCRPGTCTTGMSTMLTASITPPR